MRRCVAALAVALAATTAAATLPAVSGPAPAAPGAAAPAAGGVTVAAPAAGPGLAADGSEGELVEVVESTDARGREVATRTILHSTTGAARVGALLRGSVKSHKFMARDSRGRPAHWNRCQVIRYRINPANTNLTVRREMHAAIRQLARSSGLRFRFAGFSSVTPYAVAKWHKRIPRTQPAHLYLAVSDERRVPGLRGGVVGMGGPLYRAHRGREPQIVLGGVVIDRAARVSPGFGAGPTRGALLLHELGHAVNLGHVRDRYQVMSTTLSVRTRAAYQRGDRTGLARLRSYRCF